MEQAISRTALGKSIHEQQKQRLRDLGWISFILHRMSSVIYRLF